MGVETMLAVGAGASLLSGAMNSSAISDAAGQQSQAAAAARAQSDRQFNQAQMANAAALQQSREDQAPWLGVGKSALEQLASGYGINTGSGYGVQAPDRNAIFNRVMAERAAMYGVQASQLDGTVERRIADAEYTQKKAEYDQGLQQYIKDNPNTDPSFGAFTRPGTYTDPTPTAKFTSADLAADPVYNSGLQFGLDEGVKGVNRQAAAAGSLNSGATLKALTRFANDYGSTKANDAYNRFNTTGTNLFNQQKSNADTQFNRDQIQQGNVRNGLASLAGVGQTAAQQLGSQGLQTAQVNGALGQSNAQYNGNALMSEGNARGASAIAGSNALSSGLTGAYNGYQQQQLMNRLMPQQQYPSTLTNYTPSYAGMGDMGWTSQG